MWSFFAMGPSGPALLRFISYMRTPLPYMAHVHQVQIFPRKKASCTSLFGQEKTCTVGWEFHQIYDFICQSKWFLRVWVSARLCFGCVLVCCFWPKLNSEHVPATGHIIKTVVRGQLRSLRRDQLTLSQCAVYEEFDAHGWPVGKSLTSTS